MNSSEETKSGGESNFPSNPPPQNRGKTKIPSYCEYSVSLTPSRNYGLLLEICWQTSGVGECGETMNQ